MGPLGVSQHQNENDQEKSKTFFAFAILALILHLIFLSLKLNQLLPSNVRPPLEVQQIDPKKLHAIRKQWKEQSLLLQTQPPSPQSASVPAPENAQMFSDRNIRVEKEQRARTTSPIVKPQIQTQEAALPPRSLHSSTQRSRKAFPQLKSLGLPLLPALTQKNTQAAEIHRKPSSHEGSPPLQEGAHQYISDSSIPEGSENLLNAQESIYYSFYARLYESIGPIWQSKIREIRPQGGISPGEYLTSVDVIMDSRGKLLRVEIIKSSGVHAFDSAVDASWQKIGFFPHPPRGLLTPENIVHTGWSFIVKVGEGFQFYDLPPTRNY